VAVLSEANEKGKGFHPFLERGQQSANAGVSVVLDKKYETHTTYWNSINDRIGTVKLNIFGRKMNILGVYAPTNSYTEKAKDKFWETLKDCLDKIFSTSEIFLMGDFSTISIKNCSDRRTLFVHSHTLVRIFIICGAGMAQLV
jgi:exonuclease III